MSGVYVFALAGEAAAPFVAAGHHVEFVKTHGVYAAIERASEVQAVSEEALRRQHEVVAEIASRVEAVLPARFGTLVAESELGSIVLQRHEAILEALALVRGRTQMTVRLLGSEPVPAPVQAPGQLPATGAEYLEIRRAALATPRMPALMSAAADAVRGIVMGERFEPGRGRVAATLYHLIDPAQVKPYRKALEPLQRQSGAGALTVTGPWPPFAFAPDLWT